MVKGASFSQNMELDQVFMTDEKILEKIVSSADLKKTETVLEIGTGSGNLTKMLALKSKKVITIEIDPKLKPILLQEFKKTKNVQIVWGNALEVLANENLRFDKIVSNPPYAIAEPLIKMLFRKKFKVAILTLPWRFVERLTANPEEHTYSKLSLFALTFFRIETLLRVSRSAWSPQPDTLSFIVRLSPKKPANEPDKIWRELILQSDKKLKNAMREAIIKSRLKSGPRKSTKRLAKNAIEDAGFPKKLLEKKISEMGLEELREIMNRLDRVCRI